MEELLLAAIEKHKIAFFSHCFAFVPFTRTTAYNNGLDKLDSISNLIAINKQKAKNYMLNKWIASSNPTLQMAAYRLLSESEEHKLLNQTYIDHTTKTDKIQITIIDKELKNDEI